MSTTSTRTLHILERLVNQLPIGTNLALLQLMWAIVAGHFLTSRGAVHSALTAAGFNRQEIQRSWSALRRGIWNCDELVTAFNDIVHSEGSFQAHQYAGYRPVAVDITAIWRPKLTNWGGTVYRQLIGKRFRGIGFGLIARVGQIDGQRLPLIQKIVRCTKPDDSEETLKTKVLHAAAASLSTEDVLVHDAGVSIADVQALAETNYVIRLASNCTARRPSLPAYKGKGRRPEKGELLRPLARTWQDRLLPATDPDVTASFRQADRIIKVRGWREVMRADLKVADEKVLYTIWVFDDPLYKTPLVLGTNLLEADPAVIYKLYVDRWPVEQVPLVAKQLLGCHRQFVFAPTSCWRLGELALLMGNLLTWLAATGDPIASGYWDRVPKKRQDAIGSTWRGLIFQKSSLNCHDFEKSGQKVTNCRKELRLIVV